MFKKKGKNRISEISRKRTVNKFYFLLFSALGAKTWSSLWSKNALFNLSPSLLLITFVVEYNQLCYKFSKVVKGSVLVILHYAIAIVKYTPPHPENLAGDGTLPALATASGYNCYYLNFSIFIQSENYFL